MDTIDTNDDTLTNNNIPNNNNSNNPQPKKDIHQFWEQTKQNITKSINELAVINNSKYGISNNADNNNNNNDDESNNNPDSPRGMIDLHKENVTVAALSDHEKSLTSVSPTPYGLC